MTRVAIRRVSRTDGPGLCIMAGCGAAMRRGVLCNTHDVARTRAVAMGRRPAQPPKNSNRPGLGPELYWLDLDQLAAAWQQVGGLPPRGVCEGSDVNFYDGPKSPAQLVCATCPALYDCLAWAIRADERWGLWGGCIRAERVRVRRALRRHIGAEAA